MAEIKPARVERIEDISPSIKRLVLDTREQPIAFRPGQWVDLHLEWAGEPVVGGYSITSTPARRDRFELAIKRAVSHRATKAVHERLREGDAVRYAGGQGGFTLREPPGVRPPRRLMIAGGIGITPLLSMIRHLDETSPEAGVTLLYSARGASELVFRDALDAIAARRAGFRVHYFVTGAHQLEGGGAARAQRGRIDDAALKRAWLELATPDEAYVCGPPPMTESMVARLEALGMPEQRIRFERWW